MEELGADLDKLNRGAIPDAVPEMMARSGGFNVPADFFKERGMPAPVPATPLEGGSRRRWGVYAGVAGVAAAIAIVVGIFAKSSSSTASRRARRNQRPQSLAAPGPAPTPRRSDPTGHRAQGRGEARLFATDPLDAHVFQDGQDLGSGPLTLDVPVGQKLNIEVRRDGYRPQTMVVDGAQPKIKVKLVGAAPMAHAGGKPGRQARARARCQARTGRPAVARRRRDRQSLGQVRLKSGLAPASTLARDKPLGVSTTSPTWSPGSIAMRSGSASDLREAGKRGWIVGGCVRDLLLGKTVSDWDIATDARPTEVMRIFSRVIPTGIEHGTVTVLVRGVPYEVTTLRGETTYSDGRRPDAVVFVDDITADLARRDFTINAIAIDPLTPALIDPFEGQKDLGARSFARSAIRSSASRRTAFGCCALRASRRRSNARSIRRRWPPSSRRCPRTARSAPSAFATSG